MATSGAFSNKNGQNSDLLEELRAAHAADPSDLKAAVHLAEHYADLGWLNESIDLYRELLADHGDDYFLLLGFGNTCYRRHRIDDAQQAFHKLTRLQPARTEGWNNYGIALLDLGKVEEAAAAFDQVLAIEPLNAGALLNLGNCHARGGRHEDAIGLFEQAIKATPDSADAWYNLGNSHLAIGDLNSARVSYERALRYQREFPSALKNLGFVLARLGEQEMALDCLAKAADLDPTDPGIPVNMAGIYLEQDRVEEAKRCCIDAVRLDPGHIEAWRSLQRIAFMKGDLATYTRCTVGILPRLDDESAAGSVEILVEHGRFDEAREIIAAADMNQSGNEFDSQRLITWGHFKENCARCAEIVQRLSTIANPSDRVLRALVRFDFSHGNLASVVSRIKAMRQVDASMQHFLVGALITLGKPEEALSYLQQFSATSASGEEFAILFAHLAIERGRHGEAREHLLRAIDGGADFAEIASASSALISLLDAPARAGNSG